MSPNILASADAFARRVPIKMATRVAFGAFCCRPMVPDRLLEAALQPHQPWPQA